MSWIKNIIGGLLSSKKFVVLVSGLVVTAAAKYKFNLDPLMVQGILGALIAWLIGQSLADQGKEAAKITAVATVAASPAIETPKAEKAMEAVAEEVKAG